MGMQYYAILCDLPFFQPQGNVENIFPIRPNGSNNFRQRKGRCSSVFAKPDRKVKWLNLFFVMIT